MTRSDLQQAIESKFFKSRKAIQRHPWLASFILILLCDWIIVQFHKPITEFNIGIYIVSAVLSALLMIWLDVVRRFFPQGGQRILSLVISIVLAFIVAANYFVYREFGENLSVSMVRFVVNNPLYFAAFVRTYLLNFVGLGFLGLAGIFFWVWCPQANHRHRSLVKPILIAVFIPIIYLVVLNQVKLRGKGMKLTMDTATIMAFKKLYADQFVLHPSLKRIVPHNVILGKEKPYNILLIINESWGKNGTPFYSTSGAMQLLKQRIANDRDHWCLYRSAFSNSSATDVSMPSLLTGVAPHQDNATLHSMPLVWDWTRSQGLYSLLVSSQSYRWGDLDSFFFSPGPDHILTADLMNTPLASDMGVDDIVSADSLCRALDRVPAGRSFFALYQTNALHGPFQQTSTELREQFHFSSRYENALAIVDVALEKIFQALERTRQLDHTIIILTADHGEVEHPVHTLGRVCSFYDEIMNIPFMIYVPATWRTDHPEEYRQLKNNESATVQNLDIVPTIATLIGADHDTGNGKILAGLEGRSLTENFPQDRTVIALNTNDVRTWDPEGFGIYRGLKRFVYSTVEHARYFDIATDSLEKNNLWLGTTKEEKSKFLDVIRTHRHLLRIFGDGE